MCLLTDCGLVEIVQKMWRHYLKQELLEQRHKLPPHLNYSLQVIHIYHLLLPFLLVSFYLDICMQTPFCEAEMEMGQWVMGHCQ